MGIKSGVIWCDSSLNGMMGCNGCELLTPKVQACYAYLQTQRYAGSNSGWPKDFHEPELFVKRFDEPVKWPDLTGKDRPGRPWLNGLPRLIFHGDFGDYWTESFAVDWLHPYIDRLAKTPHIHMFLSKRPRRMFKCFDDYGKVPENFWFGTSVLSQDSSGPRLQELTRFRKLAPKSLLFVSLEPLLTRVELGPWLGIKKVTDQWQKMTGVNSLIDWLLIGGESQSTRFTELDWILDLVQQGDAANVPVFVKQLGSAWATANNAMNKKGENPDEWPRNFRVRQGPNWVGKKEVAQSNFWSDML